MSARTIAAFLATPCAAAIACVFAGCASGAAPHGHGADDPAARERGAGDTAEADPGSGDAAERPAARDIAPGLSIVRSGPPRGTLDGAELQPGMGERQSWTVLRATGSDAPSGEMVFRAEPTQRFGAQVAVSEGDLQTLYLVRDASGAVSMVASYSRGDDAISRFEPALPMSSPQLPAGESVQGTARMTVLTAKDPPKERDRGTATRRLAYTRDETIRTGSGEHDCRRVEIEFDADLGAAKASIRSVRWILPGVGAIAEDRRERIVVLGLFPSERTRVLVRSDAP